MQENEFVSELNKRVARIRELDNTENTKVSQAPIGYGSDLNYGQGAILGSTVPSVMGTTYRPSLKEEAEKATAHHQEQMSKHHRASTFFRDHPEFDEFIQLIRAGTIQL